MQTVTQTCRVFKGAYEWQDKFPATAEAFDEASGSPGDCVAAANDKHKNHNLYGKVRSVIADALVKAGHKRETNEKGVATEGEDAFVQRLLASGALTKAELKTIGDAACAEKKANAIDTLGADGAQRAEIGASWLEDADRYIAAWTAGVNPDTGAPASAELTLQKMQAIWKGATLNDPTNQDEVARLLRDFDKRRRAAGTL